ncbi:MAG: hypothetical protein ACJ0BT_01490 [Pseudohongiellaceae bacterium]
MQELLDALSSPGTMNASQWLVIAISLFVVLGSLYFILKLIKIIRGIGKTTYTPHIGLSKHPYKGQAVSEISDDVDTDNGYDAPESASKSE